MSDPNETGDPEVLKCIGSEIMTKCCQCGNDVVVNMKHYHCQECFDNLVGARNDYAVAIRVFEEWSSNGGTIVESSHFFKSWCEQRLNNSLVVKPREESGG